MNKVRPTIGNNKGGNMVKLKKKYFEFKSNLMGPKDFKHKKINLYVEPKAYNKVMRLLSSIEDKLIDKSKIKKGKRSPLVISESFEGANNKWKIAGPINTPQTHNLIVGAAKRKDTDLAWRRSMIKKRNIDLVNYIINETDDMQSSEYQTAEVKWCKQELIKRNHLCKELQ
jgi:hypothetical protein